MADELSRDAIESALRDIGMRCTAAHGYDPAQPGAVDEHALAPGEQAWRECVYTGIRTDLVPRSSMPAQYEDMIARDIEFTAAIEAGQMTRFERWRTNQMAADLAAANEALGTADEARQAKERLDTFQQRQLEKMLRVPAPQMIRMR